MGGVATRGAGSAARSPSPPLLRLLLLLGALAGAGAQADAGGHGGGEHEPAGVWGPLVGALCMLLIGGTAAGLTIGLLSTDVTELELTMESGPPDKRRKARKIFGVLQDHHKLLVTLLLVNCAANEALPIFLDELVPQVVAVLLSVTLVLLFGEILPSALFSGPRRLDLGAAMVPLVRGLLFVLTPISWPIAKALDKLLGHEELNTRFDRHQMRTLVELHRARNQKASHGGGGGGEDGGGASGEPGGGLTDTEAQVIFSTLEAHNKTPRDVMTSWERAKTISHGAVLDEAEMVRLMRYGYSRFPVWKGDRNNIVGYLRLQKLLTVSPEDRRPVASFALRKPLVVHPLSGLFDLLKMFKSGKSHMAIVTKEGEELQRAWRDGRPAFGVKVLGLVTLEDVIEELIGEESALHRIAVLRHTRDAD